MVIATDLITGLTAAKKVIDLIRHAGAHTMVAIRLSNGSTIHATDQHPFWVENRGEWVSAIDLRPGDHLRSANGDAVTVTGSTISTNDLTAYNLTVAGIHTYYVQAGEDAVLVHNCAAPNIRISPAASDWATKGAHIHVGGSEVRIFPTEAGGVGFEGIRLSTGMASARDIDAARNAIMGNPYLRADLIDKAGSAMAGMNSHNWGNLINRAAEMNFLIKALEKIR